MKTEKTPIKEYVVKITNDVVFDERIVSGRLIVKATDENDAIEYIEQFLNYTGRNQLVLGVCETPPY